MRRIKPETPKIYIPYSEEGIEEVVKKQLKQYQGKHFYCKALGVNVSVTRKSIDETAHNCRNNRRSAELALCLPEIIEKAKIKQLHLPTKSNQQKKHFHFKEIAILVCNLKGKGIAKLVVGFRDNGEVVEYSITNFQPNVTSQFID